MTASLPMYDMPHTAAANDRLWQHIRRYYGKGPRALDRVQDPHLSWIDPALVFSQTCGLPYRSALHGRVQLVATPDYGVEGCPAGYYRSHLIVRKGDRRISLQEFEGARVARNDIRSQSGWAALTIHFAQAGIETPEPGQIAETGSHAASMQAVAEGRADIAAIDAVTWALHMRRNEVTTHLRILESTAPTPGLPYITGAGQDAETLFRATERAIEALSPDDRDCLSLHGIVKIPATVYLAVPGP